MNQLNAITDEKHVVLLQSTKDVNIFLAAPLDYPSLSLIRSTYPNNKPQMAHLNLD
jgi:hypothetical protein